MIINLRTWSKSKKTIAIGRPIHLHSFFSKESQHFLHRIIHQEIVDLDWSPTLFRKQ